MLRSLKNEFWSLRAKIKAVWNPGGAEAARDSTFRNQDSQSSFSIGGDQMVF